MNSKAKVNITQRMIEVSFAETPSSLGGVSDYGVDSVATRSSFYRRLPRMKSLPPPLTVPASINRHKELRQMYEKLSRGDFFAKCVKTTKDETGVTVSFNFGQMMRTIGERFLIVFYADQATRSYFVGYRCFSSSPRFIGQLFALLSDDEQRMLNFRIIQHYVRSSGFRLSEQELQLFRDISWNIIFDQGKAVLALDIAMSLADIRINLGADQSTIRNALDDVCSVLKVLGRHTDAALVYEETAEDYCELEVHETKVSKFDMFAFAGDQWSDGKKFDKAEEAYIKALNILSRNSVNLLDQRSQLVIQKLLTSYSEWSKSEETEPQEPAEISAVKGICATLLAISGFRLEPALIHLINPTMIQDNLEERKEAQLALDRAVSKSSTSQSFRDAILACSSVPRNKSVRKSSHNKEKNETTLMTNNGRENASQGKGTGAEAEKCSNPTCGSTGSDIMQCLCRDAYYCDKRCQKAHWKEHKRTCTYYLDRKKSNK